MCCDVATWASDFARPVRKPDVKVLDEVFVAAEQREYCWMWTTPAGPGATLEYVSNLIGPG